MTQFEIGALIGAGLVIAFTMGFLLGIGYQQAEDRMQMRMARRRFLRMVEKAKKEAEEQGRAKEEAEWIAMMQNPMSIMPWEQNIKFGDE